LGNQKHLKVTGSLSYRDYTIFKRLVQLVFLFPERYQ